MNGVVGGGLVLIQSRYRLRMIGIGPFRFVTFLEPGLWNASVDSIHHSRNLPMMGFAQVPDQVMYRI